MNDYNVADAFADFHISSLLRCCRYRIIYPMPGEIAEWCLLLFMIFWFCALGSTIGSFLNVVVYRLPLGLSLSYPPSRCPDCETPIDSRDNIPILGWLKLGGRCRNCRTPISIRYPAVEATVGFIFVILMLVELHSGGANLPLRQNSSTIGYNWFIGSKQPELIGIYTLQCLLLCTLLAGTLIVYDGEKLPYKLFLPVIVLGVLLPMFWPSVQVVPLSSSLPGWLQELSWHSKWALTHTRTPIIIRFGFSLFNLITSLVGIGVGILIGSVFHSCWCFKGQTKQAGTIIMLGVLGLILGWQAVFTVVIITLMAAFLLGYCVADWRRFPISGWLTLAVLIQIIYWKQIYEWTSWQ